MTIIYKILKILKLVLQKFTKILQIYCENLKKV